MWHIALPILILSANGYPIENDTTTILTTESTVNSTTDLPVEIQSNINVVTYIQYFKTAMMEYVTAQYRNLTIRESEEVQEVLENFLKRFARDLKESVDRQFKNEGNLGDLEKIEDGIPDETFNDINERVRAEFPDINEETAKDIVYRLRKNLFDTRQKLDSIIRNSKQAQIELD